MIEEALVEKMATWKYDPSKMKSVVTEDLLKALKIYWNKAVKLEKDIREQKLRQVMFVFSDKDVKDALASYESMHTPRFRIFEILGKKMEDVV